METDLHSGKKRDIGICADDHDAIIPFHEFVDQNERVFELINDLAQENIRNRPVFVYGSTSIRGGEAPLALLEDWEEANRLIGGGSIDVKNITGDHLASKVREYSRIYRGEIKDFR